MGKQWAAQKVGCSVELLAASMVGKLDGTLVGNWALKMAVSKAGHLDV